MSDQHRWLEPPRVEWQGARPFVYARLEQEYARRLEYLAHQYTPSILQLPGVHSAAAEAASPTASRYPSYNVFLLDEQYTPLLSAIRDCYRVLVKIIDGERQERFIKSWFNVTTAGHSISRHRHRAVFIGTFSARAEGSQTRFGLSPETNEADHIVENRDGQLLLTTGMNHYHEVSSWQDQSRPRVTYAFDVINASQWRADRVQVPFDGAFK